MMLLWLSSWRQDLLLVWSLHFLDESPHLESRLVWDLHHYRVPTRAPGTVVATGPSGLQAGSHGRRPLTLLRAGPTASRMARWLPRSTDLTRFCQKLNRVKTLEDDMMETSFNRCLSTIDLTLLGIGGMVGSGLYVLTGTVAKEIAGPAVIVSFIIAGFASLLAALCYAEFGARVPKTGSAYMFTYVSVGEIWAFLIGWNVLLEYMIGGAAVARAWSGYLDSIFNHKIKNFTETHVGAWQVPFLAHYPDFLAAAILLVATAFISFGAKVSSWLNHVFSAISMGVILFILIMGFVLAQPKNWSTQEGGFAPYGLSGIMAGTATCFYAFVGFDVIAASSEEARNPQRAVPRAIAFSLGLATGAYILVSVVLTLMVPWHTLDPDSALADAFYRRGYAWAGFLVAAGSICAMNTVLLSNLFSLPRIVYAMAEDGLFFQIFSRVHPRTQQQKGDVPAPAPSSRPNPEPREGPSGGELKEYESFSDKLQLVDRDKSKEQREPGQLKAAFEPYLEFLSDFYPGEVITVAVVTLMVSAICLCSILVFGSTHLHLPTWSYSLLLVLFSLGFLLSLLLIWAHEQQHSTQTFQIPLVPLSPALSIILNIYLMLKLSYMTWLRFAIWLLLGLLVYFGYGIWHSKENLREPRPQCVSARYVVFPGGSLEERVQAVQPSSQPATGLPDTDTDDCKR
ncbi:cationic amino acid transporter 4 isoform 2-T8 [Acridotheres tristis]